MNCTNFFQVRLEIKDKVIQSIVLSNCLELEQIPLTIDKLDYNIFTIYREGSEIKTFVNLAFDMRYDSPLLYIAYNEGWIKEINDIGKLKSLVDGNLKNIELVFSLCNQFLWSYGDVIYDSGAAFNKNKAYVLDCEFQNLIFVVHKDGKIEIFSISNAKSQSNFV